MKSAWLIWSIEHRGWWKHNRNGYTQYKAEAGWYSYEEAVAIVEEANKYCGDVPNEAMVELVREREE